MSELFIRILNTSITAGYLVLAVLLLRFALKRAPKWSHCLLWAIVALRLLLPFSIESAFSLIPSAEPIPPSTVYAEHPAIDSGIPPIDEAINPILSETLAKAPAASADPGQILIGTASVVLLNL